MSTPDQNDDRRMDGGFDSDAHGAESAGAPGTPTSAQLPRRILALVALWVPSIALLIGWVAWSGALPDTLPMHWSGDGAPDGFGGTTAVFVGSIIVAGVAALVGTLVAVLPVVRPIYRRGTLFFTGLAAGIGAVSWLLAAALTLGADGDPTAAALGPWLFLPLTASLWGLIPYFLQPRAPKSGQTREAATPLHLGADETGAWSRATNGAVFMVMLLLLVAVVCVLLVPLFLSQDGFGAIAGIAFTVLIALLALAFVRVRVTVDRRGLRVLSGTLGLRVKHIPLDEIESVEADQLVPMQWGGWGYRFMPGRSAVIVRGGEGLVVTRTNGNLFAVSTNDARTAAGLLVALRDRQALANG
jgi:NADH:ubiquinone oxidoreductase subunit 3 (subunit A)